MPKPDTIKEPSEQRDALLEAQRRANRDQPRNFKEDAITDKQVTVEPDGTGPTSTGSFDADTDQKLGSGHEAGVPAARPQDGA